MDARFRPAGQKGTRFVHTLHGSGIAVGRALIAVMENYQRAKDLLQRHMDKLYLLAEGLLEREVLEGPEIEAIVSNGTHGGSSDHGAALTTEDEVRGC